MAYLVKPNLKPQKWLLKKLSEIQKINTIISSKDREGVRDRITHLERDRNLSKSIIQNFCQSQNNYKMASYSRSIRRYKTRLAIETIILLIAWQKNIKQEAHALLVLAQKIAANITDTNAYKNVATRTTRIEQELLGLIKWQIIISENRAAQIHERYKIVTTLYAPHLVFKEPQENVEALLVIHAFDLSFTIDFCAADIDKILNTVQNQLHSI